jgi:hypothetical protein
MRLQLIITVLFVKASMFSQSIGVTTTSTLSGSYKTEGTPYEIKPGNSNDNQFLFGGRSGAWSPVGGSNNSIEGSPYLFETNEGDVEVVLADDKKYKLPKVNYNLVTEKLISNFKKDSIFEFNSKMVSSFKKNNKTFKFYPGVNNTAELFEVVFGAGKAELLKKPFVKVLPVTLNPMTKEVVKNARYELSNKYVVRKQSGEQTEIKLKKKDVIKCLSDKKEDVEKFISSNKIECNTESDIIKVIKYYNSI